MQPELLSWKRTRISPRPDEGRIVSGVQLATILHDTALAFIVDAFGVSAPSDFHARRIRPLLRALSSTFDSPLGRADRVLTGARTEKLGSRSFVIGVGIWTEDEGRIVAHGTVSFIAFDAYAGKAVTVPEDVAERLRTPGSNHPMDGLQAGPRTA